MSKTTEQFTDFDIAEELDTPEMVAEYLNQVLADGDPAELIRALGDAVRAIGMTRLAKDAGVGRESLYKTLAPGANPRIETVMKIVNALGINLKAEAKAETKTKAQTQAA